MNRRDLILGTGAVALSVAASKSGKAEDPELNDSVWQAAAQRHFTGQVVVGRDLLEI